VISIPCNLVRKDGVLLSCGKKCQRMDIAGENMGRNLLKEMNLYGAITNVHIQVVK
jgi:hypothetical protein